MLLPFIFETEEKAEKARKYYSNFFNGKTIHLNDNKSDRLVILDFIVQPFIKESMITNKFDVRVLLEPGSKKTQLNLFELQQDYEIEI